MKYDLIIIGGGASGLCTALMSKKDQLHILVMEHGERVGKKILSTGNGKCNLTNRACKVEKFTKNPEGIYPYYSSSNRSFIETVIDGFDADDTIRFFEERGFLLMEKNGYVYPRSEQASSVLDFFRFSCENAGVEFLCGYHPKKLEKTADGTFRIDDTYEADRVVIATGGMSAPKTGSDGSGYELAMQVGHTSKTPLPALCALKCSNSFLKELAGVRTDARLTLKEFINMKASPIASVSGNVQFTEYGISGIPVFQLSLIAAPILQEGREVEISIDLLPDIKTEFLADVLDMKEEPKFLGILNKKFWYVIDRLSRKAHPEATPETLPAIYANMIKNLKVYPTETVSFAEAQTTLGGINTDEINPHTMESKYVPGLFFAGEVVDVSGICGGYNLQWAFSTAAAISRAVTEC